MSDESNILLSSYQCERSPGGQHPLPLDGPDRGVGGRASNKGRAEHGGQDQDQDEDQDQEEDRRQIQVAQQTHTHRRVEDGGLILKGHSCHFSVSTATGPHSRPNLIPLAGTTGYRTSSVIKAC